MKTFTATCYKGRGVYIEFVCQILSTAQSVDFTLLVVAPYARAASFDYFRTLMNPCK